MLAPKKPAPTFCATPMTGPTAAQHSDAQLPLPGTCRPAATRVEERAAVLMMGLSRSRARAPHGTQRPPTPTEVTKSHSWAISSLWSTAPDTSHAVTIDADCIVDHPATARSSAEVEAACLPARAQLLVQLLPDLVGHPASASVPSSKQASAPLSRPAGHRGVRLKL